MKEITKKIWVSDDGIEFLNEFDCRMHELEEKFRIAIFDNSFYCEDSNTYAISSALDLLRFVVANLELTEEISKPELAAEISKLS